MEKEIRIKWHFEERWYYGTAEYREDIIVFSSNMQNETFDRVDAEDLDDGIDGLDFIWYDLMTRGEDEEDGIPDVTDFELS